MSSALLSIASKPRPGSFDEVRKLVERGAEINYVNIGYVGSTNTPLLMAAGALEFDRSKYPSESFRDSCEIEAVKIVRYLVSKGADLNATDSSINRRNALPSMLHTNSARRRRMIGEWLFAGTTKKLSSI